MQGFFAAPSAFAAAAPVRGQTLLPGVIYSRQVEFTAHGPVVINVISAPKPTGLYALRPILSNNAILGRERVTSMEKRVSAEATVAGVNGDLFSFTDGHPTGGLIRDGVLDSGPVDFRSTVGIDTDGLLHVDRVRLAGTWQGSGQRRIMGINEVPRPNRTTLYTRAWGTRTPAENGGAQAIIEPFPVTKPNTPLTGVVTQYVTGGNQPIPVDGAVLVARGTQAGFLAAEAPVGAQITALLTLTPPWANVLEAVGGGPIIVREGKPVFRSLEGFTTDQLAYRHPRTGVGQTADGRILLVAVDGRQPGYSTGLTNFELALTMMRLGCVTASALDAGGSTTMAFDGKLLNRPSDPGGERPVAEALTLFYYGVYAPALPARVLSPNADGVDDTQSFAYKLVRPSTVTATLIGPGGIVVPLDSGSRAPGSYKFNWTGRRAARGRLDVQDGRGRRPRPALGCRPPVRAQQHARLRDRGCEPPPVHGKLQARQAGTSCAPHRDPRRRDREDPCQPEPSRRRRHDLVAGSAGQLRLQRHRHERGRCGGADEAFPPAPVASPTCRSPA